jgi:hypothetical protein|tara:strand:+ start:8592 stop:9116 length:525 start_codon:yes stop_codon:yes gene_type:complete
VNPADAKLIQLKQQDHWATSPKFKVTIGGNDLVWGDWRFTKEFPNLTGNVVLPIVSIAHLLVPENIVTLPFDVIAYRGMDLHPSQRGYNCICCAGKKYRSCNTKYPGIITNASNPHGKEYRLLDGKHRLVKMMNQGKTEGEFYFLPFESIREYFVIGSTMTEGLDLRPVDNEET